MYFVDYMHSLGIGVILDWVLHFQGIHMVSKIWRYAIIQHPDSRRGEHPDWELYI